MGEFRDSRNLTIDGVKVRGSLDGNPQNDGQGLVLRNVDGALIKESSFEQLSRGMNVSSSKNVVISTNRMSGLESDGLQLTAVQNVTIDGNSFDNFRPKPLSHPDAIQFMTAGQTVASSDIFIRNNVLLQSQGTGPQGVFLRDEAGNLPYRNVVIENNLMYGADYWHGVFVDHAKGVRVSGNTVVSPSGDKERFWIDVKRSDSAVLTKNVTDDINVDALSTRVSVTDNIDFSVDPTKRSLLADLNSGSLASTIGLTTPGYGYQQPTLANQPAKRLIWGTTGNDVLVGTAGADQISGVTATDASLGRGTIDRLTGGASQDVFVLGARRGSFYNDGNSLAAGRSDYAQILDFSVGDKIQLAGLLQNYVFRSGTIDNRAGLEIYRDTNANGRYDSIDELVGHVAGVTAPVPDYFTFV